MRIFAPKNIHRYFLVGIALKGLDGILEVIGGSLFYLFRPERLHGFIFNITAHELSEDKNDIIANFLRDASGSLSLDAQHFAAWYLTSHGIVKIFLVAALFKRKSWAYPIAIFFLALFVVYQLYRYFLEGSLLMLALTIFDLIIIALTWYEYKYSIKRVTL